MQVSNQCKQPCNKQSGLSEQSQYEQLKASPDESQNVKQHPRPQQEGSEEGQHVQSKQTQSDPALSQKHEIGAESHF